MLPSNQRVYVIAATDQNYLSNVNYDHPHHHQQHHHHRHRHLISFFIRNDAGA